MGKCYYCNYCERYFKDVPATRLKHITSLQHVKNREEYYSQFKDPEKVLQEEQTKKLCTKYFNGNQCSFGSVCKYSHYSLDEVHYLQMLVAVKKQKIVYPETEKIMKEYFEDIEDADEVDPDTPLFPNNPALKDIPNLPPSLKPITLRNFKNIQLTEWGRQSQ